jgi:hypothetical protein
VSDLIAAVWSSLSVILLAAGGTLAVIGLFHSWRCVLDARYRRHQGDVSIEFLLVWFSVAVLAVATWFGVARW